MGPLSRERQVAGPEKDGLMVLGFALFGETTGGLSRFLKD